METPIALDIMNLTNLTKIGFGHGTEDHLKLIGDNFSNLKSLYFNPRGGVTVQALNLFYQR